MPILFYIKQPLSIYKKTIVFNEERKKQMNQASQDILDYIVDNHLALRDITDEGISKAIDALFNFNDLLPKEQVLFNSIMAQAIDFEWIAQQLQNWAEDEELKRLDAQREDYYDNH
jgi:hypothetical protein